MSLFSETKQSAVSEKSHLYANSTGTILPGTLLSGSLQSDWLTALAPKRNRKINKNESVTSKLIMRVRI